MKDSAAVVAVDRASSNATAPLTVSACVEAAVMLVS
jgi:hypothetical protein